MKIEAIFIVLLFFKIINFSLIFLSKTQFKNKITCEILIKNEENGKEIAIPIRER